MIFVYYLVLNKFLELINFNDGVVVGMILIFKLLIIFFICLVVFIIFL